MADNKNCRTGKEFENWAQTIQFKPGSYCQPKDEASVRDILAGAAANGKHLRVQGNGHSWSQFLQTPDTLVWLKDVKGTVRVDPAAKTAAVPAGIKIEALVDELRKKGLGLQNTGSILKQSIAGAISTGTHGTGLGLGNLATHVVGMKLLTMKNGQMTELVLQQGQGAETDELLRAARVSVGALGVITEVTLQCRDDYRVELTGYQVRIEDFLQQPAIDALNASNQRVRLWWGGLFQDRDDVIVTTLNDTASAEHSSVFDILREFVDALAQGSRNNPVKLHGRYEDILTIPFEIKHRECEYAIPVERTAEALRALKEMMDEGGFRTTLPVEIRFVAADDSLLSPSCGRSVAYIGINTQAKNTEPSANELFSRFEPMMKEFGGRPHWGKIFTVTAAELDAMYPGTYARFKEIRRDLDPGGVFSNTLTRSLFGA